tara:strand:+ start:120 stop:281 length:162 start_codon:yes stop_codon:yes gene_type:complete
MPKVHNWEDWDEVEEQIQKEQSRIKTNGKVSDKNKREKNNVQQKSTNTIRNNN